MKWRTIICAKEDTIYTNAFFAPDFILSLKLECSPLRPVLMILLACDEHLSVVGYKTQEGYFLTPRADKRCFKCVDLCCRCEAHDVILPSRFYLTSDERASLVKIYTDLRCFSF